MFWQRLSWLMWCLLLVTAAACSSNTVNTQPAPPTATSSSQPSSPQLATPAPATTAAAQPALPSAESPIPTEPLTPTETVTTTPQLRLPAATLRPKGTAVPLTVSYESVEIRREPGDQATLILKVIATGGGGGYRYYHDDIQQPGATFNIAGICGKPFVHTIKVTSADGQSVALPYHVGGVCPTPTP